MLWRFIWLVQKLINFNFKIIKACWQLNLKIETIIEGFWLSILSEKQIEKFIKTFYKRSKQYSSDKTTLKGLYDWEQYIANKFVASNSQITIIGAGGGREVFALANLGHSIDAYEPDEKMVKYAKSFFHDRKLPVEFSHMLPNEIALKQCDVFWLGWGVYTQIISRDKRVKLLKNAKNCIDKTGYIIISYWPERRKSNHIKLLHSVIKKLNMRNVEQGEYFKNGIWAKYFTSEQIEQEVSMAGLKIVYKNDDGYGHAVLIPM